MPPASGSDEQGGLTVSMGYSAEISGMESNIVFHCVLVAATRLRGRDRRACLNFTPGDRARKYQKH
jgi:hypothetical protein